MANESIRLGVITEIHIVPPGTPALAWHNPFRSDQAEALLRAAVDRCLDQQVDAVAILGDLTHYADPESLAAVRRVLQTVDVPVFVLPGNHDLDRSEKPLAAFERAMDLPGVTTAPRTLALTPDIDLELIGLGLGHEDKSYVAVRSHARTGNDSRLTLVLTHFPFFPMRQLLADAGLKHAGDLLNRQEMLSEIETIPGPVLIVNGHLHVQATIADGPRLQLSVAALTEPPHDTTVLEIGFDAHGAPWAERRAMGLLETPGVTLPVLSGRSERWHVEDGRWVQQS